MDRALTAEKDPVAAAGAAAEARRPSGPGAARAITVAQGDGIGPEIMEATLFVLQEAGARLDLRPIEVGEAAYRRGHTAGIDPAGWESLRGTRVFLKAPVTTPQGGGFKSINVTTRKTLGLYANVRPCHSLHPYVATKHPRMDVVVIRENEEDLYAGIEHRQTDDVYQCLKLVTRPGTERIIRYAFEYARLHHRRKVSCFTKDNIMKLTDGLFHTVFDEVGAEYPDLEREHLIVDIGAAHLADRPERFDVIVTPNLYGDIVSDIAAQLTGSVGLGGSANIGDHCSMFEAIHGSAPDLAGKDAANPSGLLLASVMMLVHIGQSEAAERVHNAWLRTIEDGVHTPDIYGEGTSRRRVGTRDFARAVAARLGQQPDALPQARYRTATRPMVTAPAPRRPARKDLVGVDVFVHDGRSRPNELAARLQALTTPGLQLKMITNRGVKVWPDGFPETFCVDHWRCRFVPVEAGVPVTYRRVLELLERLGSGGVDWVKMEHLYTFDGERGYSLGQGE